MILFSGPAVRERFHLLAPEVQSEMQNLAKSMILLKRSLQINFIDFWGLEKEDYDITLRIIDEGKLVAHGDE